MKKNVQNSISFLSFNARSLFPKMDDLSAIVLSTMPHYDFIAVSETWCTQHDPDSLFAFSGDTLHRAGRPDRQGGGVILYVNNTIPHQLVPIVYNNPTQL